MKKTILLLVIFVNYISCCIYLEATKRYSCETPIEVSVDGAEDWTNIIIYNSKKTLNLKKDTFKKTPNLKTLSVATLKSIEVGAFNGLQKLDRLIIFESELDEIQEGVLDHLPIRSIQIFKNIKKVSTGFFKNLPDLREVDIRNNTLGEIKVGVFNNTLIYKLYLDFNGINEIEKGSFFDMDSMIFLSLTGNNLKSFDSESLLGDNSLQQLWLNRNQLTNIPRIMFSNLQDLRKLYLEINQIESIEVGTFNNNPNLDYLDLSNNKLKEIQPQIFPKQGMKLLYYLFLHNNKLTFVNDALLIRTPKLLYISYGGNPFQCPCLDETKDWTDTHNITRLCDDVYFSGERPVCVFAEIEKKKCIYDVELNENLSEIYEQALVDYPKLNLKCDTTKGAKNAALNSVA